MTTGITDNFANAPDGEDAESTWTEAANFAAMVDDIVDAPAVGVPVCIDTVLLHDTDVTVPPTSQLLSGAATDVTRLASGVVDHGTFVIQAGEGGT